MPGLSAQGLDVQGQVAGHVTDVGHEEFDVFLAQALLQQVPVADFGTQADRGVVAAEFCQHLLRHGGRRKRADAEGGVAQLRVAVQGHVALHAADVEQHLAGPGNQKTACRCRADVAAVPLEQAHAHLALQRLDAAAEGGLAQVHPLGRAREVAGVGQGQQMRQMP